MINVGLGQGHEMPGNNASPRLALQDDATWLSDAIKRTSFGLWRWDLANNQTFWTENIFRMFGLPVDGAAIDPDALYKLVHPDDREHCRLALQRSLQTGAEYRAQFRIIRGDGSTAWIESIGQVIYDRQGGPIAMEGGATEITDRIQAESELAGTHASYQKAVACAGMVVYHYDYASDSYSTVNLTQLEEMFGKPYLGSHSKFFEGVEALESHLLGELAGLDHESALKKLHAGGAASWRSEFSIRKPNGQIRWIYDCSYLLRDSEGNPSGTFGTLQDITELKLLSASVERIVEETGASGSDYLSQLALALNKTLGARFVKIAAIIENGDLYAECVASVIDGQVQPRIRVPIIGTPYEALLTENVVVFDEQMLEQCPGLNTPDGLIVKSGLGVALKSRAGKTIGACLLLHDRPLDDSMDPLRLLRLFATHAASELEGRQKEEELSRLNHNLEAQVDERTTDLQRANRELESFAYSVSHDLRQPLRAIDGFARILEMDYGERLDAEAKGHIDTIRAATRRMSNLIDDLLRLSRLISHEVHLREVDLSKLARESLAALHANPQARPHHFEVEDGLRVTGDESLLRAVLDNLIQNAWKFTVRKEVAEIKVGRSNDSFFVQDNGVGFDMKYANKLFEPFQRLHGREEFEGTGIGLATVRRIVERHKGEVWAEAEIDKGATIFFTVGEK